MDNCRVATVFQLNSESFSVIDIPKINYYYFISFITEKVKYSYFPHYPLVVNQSSQFPEAFAGPFFKFTVFTTFWSHFQILGSSSGLLSKLLTRKTPVGDLALG